MKPTFNTIAGERIKVTSIEFDTIGYFARCMEDLQLISDVFSVPAKGPTRGYHRRRLERVSSNRRLGTPLGWAPLQSWRRP